MPDGALTGRTFDTTKERTELRAWLQGRNGHANLYFSLNEPKPESECEGKAGKLLERDVARIRGIAVDLDPEGSDYNSERKRLLSLAQEWPDHFLAPATAAIDSGNGVQLIWLFPTPLLATAENIAAVKAQALGMNKMLGSDAVQSVDHLFRVPGTINLPNEKKRRNGRTPTQRGCSASTLRQHARSRRWRLSPPRSLKIRRPQLSSSATSIPALS